MSLPIKNRVFPLLTSLKDYKIVVLGAGGVGKSSLTVQFVQNVYIDTYDPTIEDSYRKQIEVDSRPCDLEILDTAGVAQFTAMRELYIKSGRGFVLVYSVTDENSLKELLELREQVLRIKDSTNSGPVPMVLVGNKSDLEDERVLSPQDGIQVSESWGKVPFYETSAMHRTNVDEAFIDVVRQIMRNEALQAEENLENQNQQFHPTNNNLQEFNNRKMSNPRIVKTPTSKSNIVQPKTKKKKKRSLCTIL